MSCIAEFALSGTERMLYRLRASQPPAWGTAILIEDFCRLHVFRLALIHPPPLGDIRTHTTGALRVAICNTIKDPEDLRAAIAMTSCADLPDPLSFCKWSREVHP